MNQRWGWGLRVGGGLAAWLLVACGGPDGAVEREPIGKEPHGLGGVPVQTYIQDSSFGAMVQDHRPLSPGEDRAAVVAALWKKYQGQVAGDGERVTEHRNRALVLGDKTMRFSMDTMGEKPDTGYPLYIALHGGGGAPPSLNDSQWEAMQTYYKASVDVGVYVAPRGVTDTWNLHFVDESYPLYDRLIENMIALEGVDPNRVYLLGFSAGGDGVYQIGTRMPDRWAAANMSAGHSNGVPFLNLRNVPMVLQVGELDGAYDRNRVTAENCLSLTKLRGTYGGFESDCFLHEGGSHNSWSDRNPKGTPQAVFQDPEAWLRLGDKTTREVDTNAVHWVSRWTRNPYPTKVLADRGTLAPRTGEEAARYAAGVSLGQPQNLSYWLDLSGNSAPTTPSLVEASYEKARNAVDVAQTGGATHLRLLLSPAMVDLTLPVEVTVEGTSLGSIATAPDVAVMARTLLERGDPSFLFDGEINLIREDGRWKVEAESTPTKQSPPFQGKSIP